MGPFLNGPYRYVCHECWKLPYLFFPNKKLAGCGECWIPREAQRHAHVPATAPRGARIGKDQEALRRRYVSNRTKIKRRESKKKPEASA